MMKKARSAIISPIIEAIIVFRALSTFDLSPPEVIHLMPPKIRKNREISAAAINRIVTTDEITEPMLFALKLHKPLNCLVAWLDDDGQGLILIGAAKAGTARLKYVTADAAAPERDAKTFFISIY